MNRSSTYHNNIALNLISSKFTSYKANNQVPLNRLIINANIRGREPEASTVNLTIMFDRNPAFHNTKHISEGEYTLNYLYLTAQNLSAAQYLDTFSTFILPFQLENQPINANPALHNEFSWQAPNCLPTTILNPVFFPYPVANNDIDLIFSIVPNNNISLSVFYLNLLSIPITLA